MATRESVTRQNVVCTTLSHVIVYVLFDFVFVFYFVLSERHRSRDEVHQLEQGRSVVSSMLSV